jgi:hypothetical protein
VATSSIYDDLDGFSLDARFGMEDVATLVFFWLMLKRQDLGDNKSGARINVTVDLRIIIFIYLVVHGHFLKGIHFTFAHGVIGSIIKEDHRALSCALK